jgi:hypothetical protein
VNWAITPEYETVPATEAPPGPVSVNVEVLIEAGAIASLKMAANN